MDTIYSAEFSEASQILIGMVLYLVSVFGTVGNISLIVALRKNRKLKNASNLLTISLAASDLLISAIAMPISGFAALNMNANGTVDDTAAYNTTPLCSSADTSVRISPAACTVNGFLIYVSSKISTWTLGGMAVERYIAVLHPLNYNRIVTKVRMFVVIVVVWLFAILTELPQVFGWFPYVYYHNAYGCLSPSYHHIHYEHTDFLVFSVNKKVILTFLPTPLIGYCYYRILSISFKNKHIDNTLQRRLGERDKIKPIKNMKPKSDIPSSNGVRRKRRLTAHESINIILTKTHQKYTCYKKSFIWLIIVISYAICWSPVSMLGIALNFFDAYCEKYFFRGLIITTFVVAVMNSCVNPVIYGFMHQQIRRTFVDMIFCRSTHDRLREEQQQEYLGQDTLSIVLPTVTSAVYPSSSPPDYIDRISEHSVLSNPLTDSLTDKQSNPPTDTLSVSQAASNSDPLGNGSSNQLIRNPPTSDSGGGRPGILKNSSRVDIIIDSSSVTN